MCYYHCSVVNIDPHFCLTEEGVAEHIAVPNLESNTIVKRLKIEINDNNIKLIVTILRTMVMMIMVIVK